MLVYRLTNKINGKVYVGQTIKPLERRLQIHRSSVNHNSQQAIHCAVRKYGWESFLIETIYCAKSLEELNAMETFFIILHQAFRPKHGYNRNLGGYKQKNKGQIPWNKGKLGSQVPWNKGRKMSEAFREKCRNNPANLVNAANARTHIGPASAERKAKMSQKFTGKGNPFFGRTHTAETSAKMRRAKLERIATDPAYKASLLARLQPK